MVLTPAGRLLKRSLHHFQTFLEPFYTILGGFLQLHVTFVMPTDTIRLLSGSKVALQRDKPFSYTSYLVLSCVRVDTWVVDNVEDVSRSKPEFQPCNNATLLSNHRDCKLSTTAHSRTTQERASVWMEPTALWYLCQELSCIEKEHESSLGSRPAMHSSTL